MTMPRKIFRATKMQGGNIYRPAKGKENILKLLKAKQQPKECTMKNIGRADMPYSLYKCSACGAHVQDEDEYRYCPWCGAKIKEWGVTKF